MEPETSISLRKAAAAFGPCAGGTRHALRKIIDRLETDEHFWREIAGDKNHWRTPCITMELAPSSDWFRLYSSLSDQHPIGMDDNFDHFRDQIEHLLYESDDLVVDYDQVRLIWIPDNFDDFAPNAKLLSSWSFIQSVAWVAMREFGVVGYIDQIPEKHQIGWLACLLAERCSKCSLTGNKPRWQGCQCATHAMTRICEWPPADMPVDQLRLTVSVSEGTIDHIGNLPSIRFHRPELMATFPAAGTKVARASKGNGGAPVKISEAKVIYFERKGSGKRHDSTVREAQIIRQFLLKMHGGDEKQVPSVETLRKRIREWDQKQHLE